MHDNHPPPYSTAVGNAAAVDARFAAVQIVALAAPGDYGSKAVHCVLLLRLFRIVRVINLSQVHWPLPMAHDA